MGSYGTARPATERDTLHSLNGSPVFLGQLVSANTTTPVNNFTTAAPFLQAGSAGGSASTPANLVGTLAGKMLLLQPTSTNAGCLLPSTTNVATVTIQSGVMPGVLVNASERVVLLMKPTEGWLQWVSNAASAATLLVWELS